MTRSRAVTRRFRRAVHIWETQRHARPGTPGIYLPDFYSRGFSIHPNVDHGKTTDRNEAGTLAFAAFKDARRELACCAGDEPLLQGGPMSHFFDRLRKEKDVVGMAHGRSAGTTRRDSLQPLLGNIRDWLKDGENSGLLRLSRKQVLLRDERAGTLEIDGLGVDFGGGRLLEVKPGTGAGDRVEMHFHGCRKTGSIVLKHRGEQWWIWPKNSVRQLPVPWCNRVFLDLLDDMV